MRVSIGILLGLVAIGCDRPSGREAPPPTATQEEMAETPTSVAATREVAMKPPADPTITISAIGDCALGDLQHGAGAPGTFTAELRAQNDPIGYPFAKVRDVFMVDDLTIANLEGTLTTAKQWKNPVFSIKGDPAWAKMLIRGGVDLVNLDNNHSGDYGLVGLKDTEAALDAAGVAHFGKGRVDRRTIKGIEVANLGYLGGPSNTRDRMVADVKREVSAGRTVIVSFHWGIEGYYATAPDQQRLGRAAIDAGATLVLGHHPHVV
ncbi:MAG: CapA family protein, partial [Myxococcota bacterium]